jgi:membrane-bound serine protease (ClpP class)
MSVVRWLLRTLVAAGLVVASAAAGVARTQDAREPVAVPAARQAGKVAILPVRGAIDAVTLWSIEHRLAAARAGGFEAVVLELDTPGGEVSAMLDICLRLRSDAPVNTVAWVRPKAFSAGTFLALACREIVVAPGSVFGDAAPIVAIPGVGVTPLPAAERAKQESPLLDELDAAAARRGDDPRLLHAFVAVERALWLVERDDGVRRFVDRDELESLGLAPDASARKPTGVDGERPVLPADAPLDATRRWRLVETVDDEDRLLVAQSDEALRWGLASAEVADDEALRAYFGATTIVRFPETWTESAVRLLMSWPVRVLLIAIFLVALVVEALHPGIGVAGAIAAGALLLVVGAPGLLGLAAWWEVLLVILGLGLVAAEVFVLPGLGVAGIAGAVCIVAGLAMSFTGTNPATEGARQTLVTAFATTVAGLGLGAMLLWLLSRWLGEIPMLRRAVLSASLAGAGDGPRSLQEPEPPAAGTLVVAASDLRPSGRVVHNGTLFDAQSDGAYIARGAVVRVVGRSMGTLLVEEAAAGVEATAPADR